MLSDVIDGSKSAEIWSAVISIIPSVLSTIIIAIMLAIFFYDRRRTKNEGTYNHNAAWQVFNQILVSDTEFIDFERKFHPFGILSRNEMKRVYYWFLRFNVVYRAYRSKTHKTMGKKLGESSILNEANLSFGDREFIRQQVFSRGYDDEFAQTFERYWQQIEDDNKTFPMLGAPENSRVVPRYSVEFCEREEVAEELLKEIANPDRTPKERRAALTKLMKHQAAEVKTEAVDNIARAE